MACSSSTSLLHLYRQIFCVALGHSLFDALLACADFYFSVGIHSRSINIPHDDFAIIWSPDFLITLSHGVENSWFHGLHCPMDADQADGRMIELFLDVVLYLACLALLSLKLGHFASSLSDIEVCCSMFKRSFVRLVVHNSFIPNLQKVLP